MTYDIVAFLVSWLLMLIYYAYLSRRTKQRPESSVFAFNATIREHWVNKVMGKPNLEILAIQTIRNSVMASSFMASTSILLIIGTLNISEKIGQWALHWHLDGLAHTVSAELGRLKLGLLMLDFSVAFFCFSMAIRFYNHVGYMINLSGESTLGIDLAKQTCLYLNRAGSYYAFGIRTFFFSLPIILWFFGPYFLLAATLVLIAGLAALDKVPS